MESLPENDKCKKKILVELMDDDVRHDIERSLPLMRMRLVAV